MSEQTVSFSVDASLLSAFVRVAEKNTCDNTELLRVYSPQKMAAFESRISHTHEAGDFT